MLCVMRELVFLTADIFASFGVLPLSRLRAYTLQDAAFHACSCLYTGDYYYFNCEKSLLVLFGLKLFYEYRQYSQNGG